MKRVYRMMLLALGFAGVCSPIIADEGVEPAGWPRRQVVCPPVAIPCPIPAVPVPWAPAMPATPTTPAQPTTPSTPSTPMEPSTPSPTEPTTPTLPLSDNLIAEAPARGTSFGGSLLPTVNGDLLGGGGIAGPLPVVVAPSGQIVGPLPVVVLPNGERIIIGEPTQVPVDELLRSRGLLNEAPDGSRVVGLLPPEGAVFEESFASLVSRIPQVQRGPFKVTENESPRPQTRFYMSYYFYDQVFKGFGGDLVPRVTVHQQVFGYEQAFWNQRASIGIRLPYNQVVSPGFYNDTSLADITIVTKFLLYENQMTGSLLSAGLVITPPTGTRPFESTITGDRIGGTLLQPYMGYIYRADQWYLQGFTSVVVPTDDRDVTLLTNDFQLGYFLYENRGGLISAVIPTTELHINTPLDKRGARRDPVGFVDQVTVLGGSQFMIRERSALGFAVGAPVTGPRPFSLQASVQFNLWF